MTACTEIPPERGAADVRLSKLLSLVALGTTFALYLF